MNKNETIAFVTGIVEGEGGFYLCKGPKRWNNKTYYHYRPMIEVINTDLELLRFCQSIIGGKIYDNAAKQRNHPSWKKCYVLSIGGFQNCLNAINLIRPFLVTNKSRVEADLLAEYCNVRLAVGRVPYGQRELEIYSLMKRR